MRVTGILVLAVCLVVLGGSPAAAQTIEPPFDASYSYASLGTPAGVPAPFGGLTLKAGTTDRLLIGGSANSSSGALYEIGVVRDAQGHITGFEGIATRYADAAFNDGGIAYGPDGVLFLARWPDNKLGQIREGDPHTYKIIDVAQPPFSVTHSLAALQFVPAGQPGEGSLKLSSYSGGQWYDAAVEPDGNGTFNVTNVTPVPNSTLPGGPEGFVYVAHGSPHFDGPSLLVSEYGADNIAAYDVGTDGDPIVASRRVFISGFVNPEGAFVDPLTGDYLFSTFNGGNQVIVVRGFAPPTSIAVKTTVINNDTGGLGPGNFTVHVRQANGADVPGSPQPGEESGAFYAVEAGETYTVSVDPVDRYDITIGGDCAPDGTVVAEEGVQPACTVTADDERPSSTLRVITDVVGGGWFAEDFTVHATEGGAELTGSPQPGSATPTDYPVFAGTYVVSVEAARGYATTFASDCTADGTVTLADEQLKTCTITNTAVAPGSGVVVDGYGPSRTDGDWGIAESYIEPTRAYLEDPANFGPGGTVGRSFQLAPGMREANARTLEGVDIFFTGYTPGFSYSPEEKEALRDFVLGGGTLIATTDDSGHTMVDAFGFTQGDGGGNPTPNVVTDLDHPIASGPFGTATTYNQYAATGHYPTLGPNAHEVGRNDQGTTLAVIEAGALGPGSGTAIFVADVDVFSTSGGAFDNPVLIKNLFAYAAGERTLAVGDASQPEGAPLPFTVTLPAPSTSPVSVHYATADDTATAGSDYVAAAGDLEFAPGETTKTISVAVNGDADVEADERFTVNLSGASGARSIDAQGVGTIANDDAETIVQQQQQQQQQEQELPPPEAGKNVNAVPKSGTVKVKVRGTNTFVELEAGQQIPVGSVVDTSKGRVTLVAASNKSGGTATADFYDGIFEVGQTKGAKPITTLELVEKLSCPKRGKASAAAKKKKKRKLWGDGSGKFRTDGEFSSATVRGTVWLVEDRCDRTLTKVKRGKVEVRDFVKKKTVVVGAGKQYVARRKP